ncbi:hypothetical protein L1987_80830 [Smallanthus sonchifolius]|uniref:Uncharacterized protein n=1 Tax=Smallanthus sonchifolius TaxID=185202 RepID=A0ACB8YP77_9ASTR|nr:hypothetical protein L1987_80830 [Smallanthus sonchifolius]
MGGVAVLHPQDCLNDNRHNLFLTPVKSRRTPKSNPNFPNSSPNLTRSEGRKRSPPTGVRKNKTTAPMVADLLAAKPLVMGQVKILKRGESLDVSLSILKDINDRKATNATATVTTKSPTKDIAVHRKVLPAKKKSEKEKRSFSNPNPRIDDLKIDDFALSSTNRLGPDPEMVPKQMNKNIADFFFAGSAFVDSPPPSSLPLPGFFTKSFSGAVKEDPITDLRRMLGLSLS